jgi:glycosyltransferase involved in cell wall biosynthesis
VRKPRVLQLVLSLAPGGTERLVIEICKHLTDRIDSMVCCLDERGAWARELAAVGIPVVALGRRPGFQPGLARQIARLMRTHGIDVVHCHHYSPYVYGLMAAMMAPAKLVFTEHGRLSDAKPSRKRRLVNPVLSLLPGQICAVSHDLKQHMVAEGFPARCIRVVYNGIEPGSRASGAQRQEARAALGVSREAFVVGTAGRLDPVKNLSVMLQTMALLRDKVKGAVGVIVGDGPEREALQARASALGLDGSVIFAGYRSDVRALLPAFDVYLNCSAYEGVSLTILEAMAASLPVIAAPVGGNPEVVVNHETGYLIPSRPRSIVETATHLAFEARLRRTMGDAARWRVIRHFSIARMVDEYASIYLRERHSTTSAAPATVPTPAEPISVTEATRSAV